MSARERLFALAMERHWSAGTGMDATGWKAWRHTSDQPLNAGEYCQCEGPTEDAACEALLAKLGPPALPTGTPRALAGDMLRILVDRRFHGAWNPQPGSPWHTLAMSGGARCDDWLAASFPDEPARQMAPEAVALVEALRADDAFPNAGLSYITLAPAGTLARDRAFAAWLAAGRPAWAVKP